MKGDMKVSMKEVSAVTRLMVNQLVDGFNVINSRGTNWGGYANMGNACDACGKVARLFGVQNWTMSDFRMLDARSMGTARGKFTSRSAVWFINEFANWGSRRNMGFQAGRQANITGRNIPDHDLFTTDSFAKSSLPAGRNA